MLTVDQIRAKAVTMEHLAATTGEAAGKAYRDMAVQWRLLEVEAVFMDAMRLSVAPTSESTP